jgi:hypothetical protein
MLRIAAATCNFDPPRAHRCGVLQQTATILEAAMRRSRAQPMRRKARGSGRLYEILDR